MKEQVSVGDYYRKRGAVKAVSASGVRFDSRVAENGSGVSAENYSFAPFKPDVCQAVKADGSACKARPVKNSQLCWFHLRQAEAVTAE